MKAGIGFVVFTILALASIFLLHWQPRADFDVIGILWLMQNILPLIIFSIFFVLATGAGVVWLKGQRRRRERQRERAQ